MRCIQKKPINLFRNYYNFFFIIISALLSIHSSAQESQNWIDIQLSEKFNNIEFDSNISDSNIANLFDLDLNSKYCFNNSESCIYLKARDLTNQKLRIFANLFDEDSMKIKVSIYYGINPDGYITEMSNRVFKAQKSDLNQIIKITNQNEFQEFNINFDKDDLEIFINQVVEDYKSDINLPQQEACFIIQLKLNKTSKHICISEILLNNNLCIKQNPNQAKISKLYLNSDENAVFAEIEDENILIYQDTASILQIIETTGNNRFAILNSLPKITEGRVESEYLLIDIQNKEILNSKIKELDNSYINGSEIYFEQIGKYLILNYLNNNNQYSKLLIINI